MKLNDFLKTNGPSLLNVLLKVQNLTNTETPPIQQEYLKIPTPPVPFQKPDLVREIEKFKTLTERLQKLPYSPLKKINS